MPKFLQLSEFVKWVRRVFSLGANTDVRPELMKDGLYKDAQNMRPVSISGDTGGMEAVNGEVVLYDTTDPDAASYVNLASGYTNGHEWEFWASSLFDPLTLTGPAPMLKIDGDVVAQSPLIPYVFDRPLQVATVERCRSGLLFPADHYSNPLMWDIGAVLDSFNAGDGLYFAGYTPNVNSVALNAPSSWPRLNKQTPLVDLGGPVGLPVGQYAYSLRYVDPNGNRTNWSPETPLIPVPSRYTPDDSLPGSNFPGGRTFGAPANLLAPTPYGINLRFRVDNQNGYASIEVKRRRYNDGGGILGAGVQEIVYRIPIAPNFIGTLAFVDPQQSNINPPETVPDDEAVVQYVRVVRPKSVDYSDGRLKYFNFRLEPRRLQMGLVDLSTGLPATSITKKLVRNVEGVEIPDGYSNPYNATYYKSAGRGEPYGYGIQGWDGGSGKYPTQPIAALQSYQHPNGRDIKGVNGAWAGATNPLGWGVESDIYSDDPCYNSTVDVASLTPEGPVGKTFSSTTQGTARKTDTERMTNVLLPGGLAVRPGDFATQSNQFFWYGLTMPAQAVQVAPDVIGVDPTNGYQPWDPRNNQADGSGFNVPPNVSRLAAPGAQAGSGGTTPTFTDGFYDQCYKFNPQNNLGQCFAPVSHALGLLLGGITDIPDGVAAITIARTPPAGRVVAQGMGTYDLSQTPIGIPGAIDFYPATKSTTSLLVHFPEMAAGTIDQATIDDIINNPGNYQIQMQCGVGFHTEHYGYTANILGTPPNTPWCGPAVAGSLLDMISYARVMEDHGQVNVGDTFTMGYQPIPGNAPDGNWVGFDKWRSGQAMVGDLTDPSYDGYNYSFWQANHPAFGGLATGNALFDIAQMQLITAGRSTLTRIRTSQFIYSPTTDDIVGDTGTIESAYTDPILRAFHQPWYVVNIIRVGAQVPQANITQYVNTGATFAVKQCIGIYTVANAMQDFRLEDDYEFYNSVGYLPTDYRYTYVRQTDGLVRAFLCVTNNTGLNIPVIQAAITANGFWVAPDGTNVYGLYQLVTDSQGIQYLQFGILGTFPQVGSRIEVRYPEGTPIRVFGHDVTIAPTTHAVMDYTAVRDGQTTGAISSGAFMLGGLPLPHPGFVLNPRYFMPTTDNNTELQIFINYLNSIRQWCIMWDAETRIQPAVYVNLNSTPELLNSAVQMFPFIHYVIRPYNFENDSQSDPPAGFFPQYQTDFPLEWDIQTMGGLRFQPGVNLDYARQQQIDFVGFPLTGFDDDEDYCTGYIASLEFDPIQQDMANLRTFLFSNMGVLSDETGEIKVGSTYLGGGGQNTVVFTQRGVARILTNKNVLTGASGEQVSTQSISNYWGEVMFLSRDIGLPDQLWRLWSKAYATAGESYADTFYWPDRKGWYRMRGDRIEDISRNKYMSKLRPILQALPVGYTPQMSAFFNTKYQEMWATIRAYTADNVSHPAVLVVYSPQTSEWVGEYTYRFDGYANTPDGVVGVRALTTWSLDEGYVISGNTREAWVEVPIIGDLGKYKEMVRWRVIGEKPDNMKLYDKDGTLMSEQSEAIQEAFDPGTGFLWAKLYDSFEGDWWRTMTTYDAGRRLPQDVRFFVRVTYDTDGEKVITALENLLKNIR